MENNVEEKSKNFVDELTNSVYIFGEFDSTIQTNVIPPLIAMISKMVGQKHPVPINIYIDSPGGEATVLYSLLSVITKAQQEGLEVVTIVVGEASSCASLLACYGNHRLMWNYSTHLVHLGSAGGIASTPLQLERIEKWVKHHFNNVVAMYTRHTNLPEEDLRKHMSDDYWILSAEQCLKYGLCDEIIEDSKIEFERKSSKNEDNNKNKPMDEKPSKSTKKRKVSSNSSSR